MFESCESLKELNLSHFDTSKVQMMNSMFSSCYSLKKIDLSNFNTPMLKTIQYMFNNILIYHLLIHLLFGICLVLLKIVLL